MSGQAIFLVGIIAQEGTWKLVEVYMNRMQSIHHKTSSTAMQMIYDDGA